MCVYKIENIGKNLKDYRISQGKKQTSMADLLGMNYQNYSKMERGVYQLSLEKLLEICEILHLTPNDLLVGECEPDDSECSGARDGSDICDNVLRFGYDGAVEIHLIPFGSLGREK